MATIEELIQEHNDRVRAIARAAAINDFMDEVYSRVFANEHTMVSVHDLEKIAEKLKEAKEWHQPK